jgi:hypothetical protein
MNPNNILNIIIENFTALYQSSIPFLKTFGSIIVKLLEFIVSLMKRGLSGL